MIGRNTMFGIVAGLAQVGTRLITVLRIAIAHLGLDGYGIWSIIMTTAAYMRFGSVEYQERISEVWLRPLAAVTTPELIVF